MASWDRNGAFRVSGFEFNRNGALDTISVVPMCERAAGAGIRGARRLGPPRLGALRLGARRLGGAPRLGARRLGAHRLGA